MLLAEGDRPDVLDRPRVAIVGTRAATPPGIADARAIGRYLAEQGITVVSGLAIGIDAAAHEGALEAGGGVVGVVATGLDIVYPRRHGPLFGARPPSRPRARRARLRGAADEARFPIRNRIIAALCDATVVVEATARGGARITAEWAVRYDREVLAMPGLTAQSGRRGLQRADRRRRPPAARPLRRAHRPRPARPGVGVRGPAGPDEVAATGRRGRLGRLAGRPQRAARRLHAAMAGEPATLDQLVSRTGPGRRRGRRADQGARAGGPHGTGPGPAVAVLTPSSAFGLGSLEKPQVRSFSPARGMPR